MCYGLRPAGTTTERKVICCCYLFFQEGCKVNFAIYFFSYNAKLHSRIVCSCSFCLVTVQGPTVEVQMVLLAGQTVEVPMVRLAQLQHGATMQMVLAIR